MEQEEYTKEEINWSYIEFVDNQDILDLIEKVCNMRCILFVVNINLSICTIVFSFILVTGAKGINITVDDFIWV